MTDLFAEARPTTIKALSIWQPWASLFAAGVKRHHTSYWSTDYRGPIALCAGKTLDVAGAPEDLCRSVLGARWRDHVPLGQVLAIGRLASCRPAERVRCGCTTADLAAGSFLTGNYAWRIEDIRPVRALVGVTGRQGLFNWRQPDDVELGPTIDHRDECRRWGWL